MWTCVCALYVRSCMHTCVYFCVSTICVRPCNRTVLVSRQKMTNIWHWFSFALLDTWLVLEVKTATYEESSRYRILLRFETWIIFGFRKVLGLVKNGFGFLPTRPNNTKVTWSCVFFEIFIFQFCSVGIVKNFKLWFYLGPEKGPLNGWSSFLLKFLHFILFSNLQMFYGILRSFSALHRLYRSRIFRFNLWRS